MGRKTHTDYFINRGKILSEKSMDGIYFIQGSQGYIKIGNSYQINTRLQQLKSSNPTQVWLSGVISTQEYSVNEGFQHDIWELFHVTGEWYAPVLPLLEYLNYFQDGIGLSLEQMEKKPKNYLELIQAQWASVQLGFEPSNLFQAFFGKQSK